MKGLYEILTEKKWMVSPDFIHGIRKALEQNLNTHAAFERPEKTCGFVTAVAADGSVYYPEEYQINEDGTKVRGNWALSCKDEEGNSYQNFPFVSVLSVDGPITRNGGGCSYGSIDHRDMMINAANHELCCGHVFIINTPGGSAWAKNDYQQAIDYAHSKGQPVIAFIDGLCASAGMYLASLCDERYYMNPRNEIGCIGVMAAFYTEADGSVNQFNNETYHELYDPESFDKNKAFRDIANDGDSKELVKDLAKLGVEFRADVKKACPRAQEEHLHGKVFDAQDVDGILVDGQSDFLSVIQHTFALFRQEAEPIKRDGKEEAEPKPKPGEEPEPTPEDPENDPKKGNPVKNASTGGDVSTDGDVNVDDSAVPDPLEDNNSNKNINMTNYPFTLAALGIETLAVSEDGAFMNAPLLDALEAHLAAEQKAMADFGIKAEVAQKELDEVKASLAEAQASLKEVEEQLATARKDKEASDKALADANDAHAKALEEAKAEADKALADAQAEAQKQLDAMQAVQKDLDGAKASLATAEQQLADKDAQIAQLTNTPAQAPDAGAAPANNGDSAEVGHMVVGYSYDPNKSPLENRKALDAYRATLTK